LSLRVSQRLFCDAGAVAFSLRGIFVAARARTTALLPLSRDVRDLTGLCAASKPNATVVFAESLFTSMSLTDLFFCFLLAFFALF